MLLPQIFGIPLTATTLFIEFGLSALLILLLSKKLSFYADALEKSGAISGVWIGTLLLASVTSLPEGVTTLGAALLPGALPLGVGNILGSNLFNLLIVFLLDAFYREGPILSTASQGLAVTAKSGIVLLVVAALAVLSASVLSHGTLAHVLGLFFSLGLVATYFIAHRQEQDGTPTSSRKENPQAMARGRIVSGLVFYSLLLVFTSIWLLKVCDTMAATPIHIGEQTILLERTVIGTLLLAAATSFPELFVCIHTLKLGQVNMAVGNVLGSNLVNMLFLPMMHVASRNLDFYAEVGVTHTLAPIMGGIVMSGLVAWGLKRRSARSLGVVGFQTAAVAVVYVVVMAWIIQAGLIGQP